MRTGNTGWRAGEGAGEGREVKKAEIDGDALRSVIRGEMRRSSRVIQRGVFSRPGGRFTGVNLRSRNRPSRVVYLPADG